MSPPITSLSKTEAIDQKVTEQLQAIALMWGRGHSSLLGIIEKYYRIMRFEFNGDIDSNRRRIEVQKIWRDIPTEMKDDVENAFARVNELSMRRPTTHAVLHKQT